MYRCRIRVIVSLRYLPGIRKGRTCNSTCNSLHTFPARRIFSDPCRNVRLAFTENVQEICLNAYNWCLPNPFPMYGDRMAGTTANLVFLFQHLHGSSCTSSARTVILRLAAFRQTIAPVYRFWMDDFRLVLLPETTSVRSSDFWDTRRSYDIW